MCVCMWLCVRARVCLSILTSAVHTHNIITVVTVIHFCSDFRGFRVNKTILIHLKINLANLHSNSLRSDNDFSESLSDTPSS